MDRLMSMKVFRTVVLMKSFTAAATELDISSAMCSKFVSDLENHLKARLLNRTTRQLSLTEVGKSYYEEVVEILSRIEDTEQLVDDLQNNHVGSLRIEAPPSFGSFHIARAIKGYKKLYPNISIELTLSDSADDLVEFGFDLAFRLGKLKDSSVISSRISLSRLIVCAAPEYIKKMGVPKKPIDLEEHICLGATKNAVIPSKWSFKIDGKNIEYKIKSNYLCSNIGDPLRIAAINGCGLIQLPSYMTGLDIQYGRLKPVLEEYEPEPLEINLIYANRKHVSIKIKSFIDYMKIFFESPPYWDKWIYEKNKKL